MSERSASQGDKEILYKMVAGKGSLQDSNCFILSLDWSCIGSCIPPRNTRP